MPHVQKGFSTCFFEHHFFRVTPQVAKCPVILRYFSALVSPIFLPKSTTKNRNPAITQIASLYESLHRTPRAEGSLHCDPEISPTIADAIHRREACRCLAWAHNLSILEKFGQGNFKRAPKTRSRTFNDKSTHSGISPHRGPRAARAPPTRVTSS